MIDLHTHSSASDGSLGPAALVARARARGLAALALTDHDTVAGLDEARAAASELGLLFVNGVELSASFEGRTLHLVGLHVDADHAALRSCLERVQQMRDRRNPRLAERLAAIGYPVDLTEIVERAGGDVVGRPHFAEALVRRGYVRSIDEAFDRFLGSGGAAHVRKERLDAAEAIGQIRQAGGVPILAHPTVLGLDRRRLERFVGGLTALGLAGIEVWCPGHSTQTRQQYSELATRYNLLRSGGSDFHGRPKPEIELGTGSGSLHVPDELLAPIAAMAERIRKG